MSQYSNKLETFRLESLRSFNIVYPDREAVYENVVEEICLQLNVPIAAITLIDETRQWFKAIRGIQVNDLPREVSFCNEALSHTHATVVHDALEEPRLADHPFVIGAPYFRFYIGVPLISPEGATIGTVCALDTVPKTPTAGEIEMMTIFAEYVMTQLELHRLRSMISNHSESVA